MRVSKQDRAVKVKRGRTTSDLGRALRRGAEDEGRGEERGEARTDEAPREKAMLNRVLLFQARGVLNSSFTHNLRGFRLPNVFDRG
jgi:hypothetical protein